MISAENDGAVEGDLRDVFHDDRWDGDMRTSRQFADAQSK